ncbi:Trimethyllysine dioxygenase [Lentithecium fluviatile CBS 122367]|uniref:Trimethyllysine dioxygenase n=1 Tax=Lentithecium fluviatile CBS 122367 TaxID=1168545 RepID=A0A6G1JA39_9PLEO|nr:Trimethyllysine dioxygenase [Lentithecium fluviatile CBS 122367]
MSSMRAFRFMLNARSIGIRKFAGHTTIFSRRGISTTRPLLNATTSESATRRPYFVGTHSPDARTLGKAVVENNVVKTNEHAVPNIWLRDNCQCKSCVHEDTKQRLLDTFSIPEDISIKASSETKDNIDVEWSDGHKSQYSKALLLSAGSTADKRARIRQGLVDIDLWDAPKAKTVLRLTFSESQEGTPDSLVHSILKNLRRYGFAQIDSVPVSPQATESLLSRISFIRETHYGGFYDFTADLASKDTAYTNIALEAHTDTTYFSDPAGLQAFHLLSHTEGSGGQSLLVDGFNAAEQLLKEDKGAYEVLASVNVQAHASGNEGISIMPYKGFPVLGHDEATGRLLQVRWNSSDRAAIELPLGEVGRWYEAARKFDRILKRKENEYWEQLQPGTVVIFDNWRVLHGRAEFTGKRRICGGYINRDDWISKFKVLEFGQGEVLGSLASG